MKICCCFTNPSSVVDDIDFNIEIKLAKEFISDLNSETKQSEYENVPKKKKEPNFLSPVLLYDQSCDNHNHQNHNHNSSDHSSGHNFAHSNSGHDFGGHSDDHDFDGHDCGHSD